MVFSNEGTWSLVRREHGLKLGRNMVFSKEGTWSLVMREHGLLVRREHGL